MFFKVFLFLFGVGWFWSYYTDAQLTACLRGYECVKKQYNVGPLFVFISNCSLALPSLVFYGNLLNTTPNMPPIVKYYYLQNISSTYSEADKLCCQTGGRLARIDTMEEFGIFKCILSSYTNTTPGILPYIGIRKYGSAYRWSDGTPAAAQFLSVFNQSTAAPPCITLSTNGSLYNVNCNLTLPHFCYRNVTKNSIERAVCPVLTNATQTTSIAPATATVSASTNNTLANSVIIQEICNVSASLCSSANQSKEVKISPITKNQTTTQIIAQSGSSRVYSVGSQGNNTATVLFTTVKVPNLVPFSHTIIRVENKTRSSTQLLVVLPLQSLITINVKTSVPVNYSIKVDSRTCNLTGTALNARTVGVKVRITNAKMLCVYLDPNTKQFSTYGMTSINPTSKNYVCLSNHSTIFAAMLLIDTVIVPAEIEILSYVITLISLVSLVLAFAILMLVRKRLRSTRTVVQISLCVALFGLHFFILISEIALNSKSACEAVAVIIHYFLLCSATWMLLEGVTLSRKTFIDSMNSANPRKERNVKLAVGWILPAVIVAIFALIGFLTGTYMDSNPALLDGLSDVNAYSQCWIKKNSWLLVAGVVFPLAVVLLANLMITIRVGMFVYEMSRKAEDFKPTADRRATDSNAVQAKLVHAKASLRAILMLLPVLGITWVFLLIQVNDPVLMYLNVILNGLQGFFIFLIYCVLSNEVRKSLRDYWKRSTVSESFSSRW